MPDPKPQPTPKPPAGQAATAAEVADLRNQLNELALTVEGLTDLPTAQPAETGGAPSQFLRVQDIGGARRIINAAHIVHVMPIEGAAEPQVQVKLSLPGHTPIMIRASIEQISEALDAD